MTTWMKNWLRSLWSPTTAMLVRALAQNRRGLLGYFIILFLGSALAGAKFGLVRELTNAGLAGEQARAALWLVLTIACWLIAECALYWSSLVGLRLERAVAIRLVSNTLERILAEAATRVTQVDANETAHYLRFGLLTIGKTLRFITSFATQSILVVCLVATAIVLQPLLASLSVLAGLVIGACSLRHLRIQRAGRTEALLGQRQLAARMCRLFEALPQIKVFNATRRQLDRLSLPIQRQREGDQRALLGERRAALEMNVGSAAVGIVLILIGGWLCAHGRSTLGDLTALLILHQRLFTSLKLALSLWTNAEQNGEYLKGLVLLDPPRHKSRGKVRALEGPIQTIELDGVDFAVGDTVLLADVTCRLSCGRLHGVVGPSGAGKTMFLHLLAMGAKPQDGEVRINGAPLRKFDAAAVSARIALAAWPPIVMEDSLAANLRLARANATDDELHAVLAKVALDQDLQQWEAAGGLDAELGRRGVRLSVGQLQRLSLARAFLHAPEVLLVDDLLTGLDPESLARVLSSLRAYARERIVVVIALTAEAQEWCDELLVLREGRLVAQVAPAVARSDPALRALLESQRAVAA